jgi:hypothetical protein
MKDLFPILFVAISAILVWYVGTRIIDKIFSVFEGLRPGVYTWDANGKKVFVRECVGSDYPQK